MYNVSNAYKSALARPVHRYKLKGTIRGVSFTESDVLQASFSITNKCSSDGTVEIGGTYAAELHITFVNDLSIPRYAWVGSEITAEEGLCISTNNYEWVPLGVFTVSEANYTSEGIELTAYDAMGKFDVPLDFETTSGTAFEIATLICTTCGVTLANADFDNFINNQTIFDLPEAHGLNTFRDLLGQLAQAMCAFVTINRAGELEFRMYGTNEVETIDPEHRLQGGSFSDYVTQYAAIEYTNFDGTTSVYSERGANGLVYNAGKNPLMFDKDTERNAVLAKLLEIAFVPFSVGLAGTPAYDLGDCLKFTDGLADGTKLSCIMQYDYAYNASYTAEGFGKNPALKDVTTAEQRQLQSVAQATQGKGVVFYPFTNARELEYIDGGGKATLLSITFVTTDITYVMLEGQAVLQIPDPEAGEDEPKTAVKLTYYIDGDEILTIHPEWTWSESGKHTITFMYPLIVSAQQIHRFLVMLEASGSDVIIGAGNIRAVVWGQNLVATQLWDGNIEVGDEVGVINIDNVPMTLVPISDLNGLNLVTDTPVRIGDEIIEPVGYITTGEGITMAEIADSYVFGKNIKLQTWGAVNASLIWDELSVDYHW